SCSAAAAIAAARVEIRSSSASHALRDRDASSSSAKAATVTKDTAPCQSSSEIRIDSAIDHVSLAPSCPHEVTPQLPAEVRDVDVEDVRQRFLLVVVDV